LNADSELVGDGTAIPKFMAPRLVMTFQINPSVDIFTPFTIDTAALQSVAATAPSVSKYFVQPLKLDSEDR
jgi:hypothetical protein